MQADRASEATLAAPSGLTASRTEGVGVGPQGALREGGGPAEHPDPVVLFTSSYCMGGIEAHIRDLAGGLVRNGWRVALICSTRAEIEPLRREMGRLGVSVHAVPEAANPLHLVRRGWHLVRTLRLYPKCIVHLHLQGESGGTLILFAVQLARVAALVRTLHNPPVPPISRSHRLFVRISDRFLARVICVSRETRRDQIQQLKRDPGKLVIIPNGVDLKRFSPLVSAGGIRREFGIGQDERLIGTVARLDEERKGIGLFIEMAASLAHRRPEARFMVVGDGALRAGLQQQATKLGLGDRMVFTGYRNDVPRLLAAMDVAVFPSSYEAAPYVMLEAMAMARPVVITPTGLALDVIRPGETGMLVPFNDWVSMSKAVEQLLADREIARRIGEAGRELVTDGYSTESMVERVARLYKDVTSAAPPARSRPGQAPRDN